MTTSIITVTTTYQQIFDIQVDGMYKVYIQEQAENFCSAELDIVENGSLGSGYTAYLKSALGIYRQTGFELPSTFYFNDHPERTYQLRKNNGFLEIRIDTGSNISLKCTLINNKKALKIASVFTSTNGSSSIDYFDVKGTNQKRVLVSAVSYSEPITNLSVTMSSSSGKTGNVYVYDGDPSATPIFNIAIGSGLTDQVLTQTVVPYTPINNKLVVTIKGNNAPSGVEYIRIHSIQIV